MVQKARRTSITYLFVSSIVASSMVVVKKKVIDSLQIRAKHFSSMRVNLHLLLQVPRKI